MSKHRHKKDGGGTPFSTGKPKNEAKTDPEMKPMKEAESEKDSFKKGGRAKKYKRGGRIEGHKGHEHLGKKARGGGCMAKGGGVLSSASVTKEANKRGSSDSEGLSVD